MPITTAVFPAAAAGIAMVSDGAAAAWAWAAYVQIVVAATVPNPCWLIGTLFHTPVVESHSGDYAIATGGAGAEVDVAYIPYALALPAIGAVPSFSNPQVPYTLPAPIRIGGAPRVAGRLRKSTAASAAGFTTKVIVASGTDP